MTDDATREALADALRMIDGDLPIVTGVELLTREEFAAAILATGPGSRLTVDTWASHRERCHNDDPDATIAFLHQRLDDATRAASEDAALAALPDHWSLTRYEGQWHVSDAGASGSCIAHADTSPDAIAAALAATGGDLDG